MTTAGATQWHALDRDECLRLLGSAREGVSTPAAAERRRQFGTNEFRANRPASPLVILAAQFRGILILLLAAAAAIALATGDRAEAIAIIAVLALNVAIGFVTELRANRALESLLRLEVGRALVWRDGRRQEIEATALVPGDIVEVEGGGAVPADIRLLETAEFAVNEAPLTGESVPVDKNASLVLAPSAPLADRFNMAFKATVAVRGHALGLVIATGMATEVGRIGALASGVRETRTPLEARLEGLGRRVAVLALVAAAAVTAAGMLDGQDLFATLQISLALTVAAVPEGLPVVATIAMAIGVHRMARRSAVIRRLPAVETLGSTTVVCADKTGTLTLGRMAVSVLWLDGHEQPVTAQPRVRDALRIGALANSATLTSGDPTEIALLNAARDAGIDLATLDRDWPRRGLVPFATERLWMATIHEHDGKLVATVKGAPERVLALCTGDAAAALAANEALARRGLRVLALAVGDVSGTTAGHVGALRFAGLVGLADPPAPMVAETIRRFAAAGLRTVMVTGDQRATAAAIAGTLGLLDGNRDVLDGAEIDLLDDEALTSRLATTGAMSRVSPEAKLRVVAAFQRRGEIVAMLGDGVNDAAALRQADIGVAMGRRGTDLARDAADVVLQDDRFETVAAAIEEGRVVFANIRRFVFYLFSCNLAEVLVVAGAGLAGLGAVLTPLQILWLNLVTDTFPALALAVEPAEPGAARLPPRPPSEPLLPGPLARDTVLFGALIALVTLAAFLVSDNTAVAFHTLALAQLLHLGNARGHDPVLAVRRAVANPWAIGAVIVVLLLQLAASAWAPLASVLALAPLDGTDLLTIAGFATVPAAGGQLAKWLRGRRRG